MFDRKAVAHALGGTVDKFGVIRAPRPGYPPDDRALVVQLSRTAPDGFVVSGVSRGAELAAAFAHVRSRFWKLLDDADNGARQETMLDLKTFARLVGGRLDRWGTVRVQFPGGDHSFEVRPNPDAPDGFRVYRTIGVAERERAYKYVRERLRAARSKVGA